MSITLNSNKFLYTLVAGAIVVAAVNLENGTKQLGKAPSKFGTPLFILGWIAVAYMARWGDFGFGRKSQLAVFSSFTIVASVMTMMMEKEHPGKFNPNIVKLAKFGFAAGWLLLGYTVSFGKGDKAKALALMSPVLVLLSMMAFLPWQRTKKIVDGPGMALFGVAWVFLAMSNAM